MNSENNKEVFCNINDDIHEKYKDLIDKELTLIKFFGHSGEFYYIPSKSEELAKQNKLFFEYQSGCAYFNYKLPDLKFKKGETIKTDFYNLDIICEQNMDLSPIDNNSFMLSEDVTNIFISDKIAMRDNQFLSIETSKQKDLRTFFVDPPDHSFPVKDIIVRIDTKDALDIKAFDYIQINDEVIQVYDFMCLFHKEFGQKSVLRVMNYQTIM